MAQSLPWEELELPVLEWVFGLGHDDGAMLERSGDAGRTVDGLTDAQVDDALRRLIGAGLIAGRRQETSDLFYWTGLRPAADGLRVLGEWPPREEAAVNAALEQVLRRLAEDLPDDDRSAARRAGSAVSKMSDQTVLDTVKGELRRLGTEATE